MNTPSKERVVRDTPGGRQTLPVPLLYDPDLEAFRRSPASREPAPTGLREDRDPYGLD